MKHEPYIRPFNGGAFRWETGIKVSGRDRAYDLHMWFWTARLRYRGLKRKSRYLNRLEDGG